MNQIDSFDKLKKVEDIKFVKGCVSVQGSQKVSSTDEIEKKK